MPTALADASVIDAIRKAQGFLIQQQKEDGSWRVEKIGHKEPSVYLTPLVLTSQATQALIFRPDHATIPAIGRALNFCLQEEIGEKNAVDLLAWKLLALRFSNTPIFADEQKRLASSIAKEQNASGFWYAFPGTFNLTNFSCILSLKDFGFRKNLERARAWFKKTRAKDGLGWGVDDKAAVSEISFTGNVALALMYAGEDPISQELQAARKFLEERQMKDGGWPSSKFTVADKPTTYATSLAIMSLLQLSENPFSEKITRGVKALLGAQLESGCWPLVFDEERIDYYPNLYAIKALSMYLYFRENWEREHYAHVKDKLSAPQYFSTMLASKFEGDVVEEFHKANYKSILDSKVLGITGRAAERRKEILRVLAEEGEKDTAGLIDSLRVMPQYEYLKKKSHLTQIKADVDFLRELKVIYNRDNKYFVTHRFL